MSNSFSIGASNPTRFIPQEQEADSVHDITFFGDDLKDFTPSLGQKKEPPYCPRGGDYLPFRDGLLPVRGTQVGSEG